jgi:DNA-binding response OmpR family regulator
LGKKILVVDDEPIIRQMLKDCFDIIGYEGIFAANGEQGLETFETRRNEIGLIILDMIMPGICGDRVLTEVRAIDPNVPIIISSAHANSRNKTIGMLKPDAWLDKPFKITDLKGVLEQFIPKS